MRSELSFSDMPYFVRRDIFAFAKVILRRWHSSIIFALHSRSEYHPAKPDITAARQYLSPQANITEKSQVFRLGFFLVHLTGIEPAPSRPDQNLNLARLPVPPQVHTPLSAVIINLKLPIWGNGRKAIFRRVYRPRRRARKRFSPYFHR